MKVFMKMLMRFLLWWEFEALLFEELTWTYMYKRMISLLHCSPDFESLLKLCDTAPCGQPKGSVHKGTNHIPKAVSERDSDPFLIWKPGFTLLFVNTKLFQIRLLNAKNRAFLDRVLLRKPDSEDVWTQSSFRTWFMRVHFENAPWSHARVNQRSICRNKILLAVRRSCLWSGRHLLYLWMHIVQKSKHKPNQEADRDPKRLLECDSLLCEQAQGVCETLKSKQQPFFHCPAYASSSPCLYKFCNCSCFNESRAAETLWTFQMLLKRFCWSGPEPPTGVLPNLVTLLYWGLERFKPVQCSSGQHNNNAHILSHLMLIVLTIYYPCYARLSQRRTRQTRKNPTGTHLLHLGRERHG